MEVGSDNSQRREVYCHWPRPLSEGEGVFIVSRAH